MGNGNAVPRLLVVDDEPDLVDLYSATLSADFEVHAAYGGPEAVELVDDVGYFDVALIDRRMPELSGDEVLTHLHEAAPNCRVAMVTAVEPDFDVMDMPFEEYLVKPVSRAGIRDTVDRLLRLESYREHRRVDYALASKVAALRAHKEPEELEENEEYQELIERLEAIREQLDRATETFGPDEFASAFADIGSEDLRATQSD